MKLFKFLEDLIIKRVLKKALDYLPLNGRKTLVSLKLVVLGAVLSYFGQGSSVGQVIEVVMQLLSSVEHVPIEELGLVGLVTGLVHKLLKLVYDRKNPNL